MQREVSCKKRRSTPAAGSFELIRPQRLDQRLEAIGAAGHPFACALQTQDLCGTLIFVVHRQHQLGEASGTILVEVFGGSEHAVAKGRRSPHRFQALYFRSLAGHEIVP